MAYVLGCLVPVVLAVFYVWTLGGVLGGIAWVITIGLGAAVLRYVMRKHYNPMAVYDAEQRASSRHR